MSTTAAATNALQREFEKWFSNLGTPVKGAVTWYNNTDEYVTVYTYDQTDSLRWIAYESKKSAPKQIASLRARGEIIQIYVENNGAIYDCKMDNSYSFDGTQATELEKK